MSLVAVVVSGGGLGLAGDRGAQFVHAENEGDGDDGDNEDREIHFDFIHNEVLGSLPGCDWNIDRAFGNRRVKPPQSVRFGSCSEDALKINP